VGGNVAREAPAGLEAEGHLMRELAGVIVKDVPRYVSALSLPGSRRWLRLCNRDERLEPAPEGDGVRCLWRWTSDLHAPRQIPHLGRWLLRRALAEHPVLRAEAPASQGKPHVSFIIGHRGEERAPLLLATLASIAAQEGACVECIVVQQEREATLAGRLPRWVKLVHTPPDDASLPFCRSQAFNAGARHATAPVLVLHDNDLLVPADYSRSIAARVAQGWEAVNVKRFIFYLDRDHSRRVVAGDQDLAACPPESIMQNAQGGGSVAITREAFDAIGGMDESFVGWGGEDNEFWERACLRRVWHWGELPLVHLWHPAQQGKYERGSQASQRYEALSAVPAKERVAALLRRQRHGEATC
jgi:hypothetical protein